MRILRDSTLAETFDENYPERGGRGRERERRELFPHSWRVSKCKGECSESYQNYERFLLIPFDQWKWSNKGILTLSKCMKQAEGSVSDPTKIIEHRDLGTLNLA